MIPEKIAFPPHFQQQPAAFTENALKTHCNLLSTEQQTDTVRDGVEHLAAIGPDMFLRS